MPTSNREQRKLFAVLVALVVGSALIGLGIAGLTSSGATRHRTKALASASAAATPGAAIASEAPSPPAKAPGTAKREAIERLDAKRFAVNDRKHVRGDWVSNYRQIYDKASHAYGVSWLLIASIHKQETAFSTSRGIFHGLNFANCCAGPMQFNVTNGRHPAQDSTWARYKQSFRSAKRPASYNHPTKSHPSVYDDFDAIMAAGSLLHDDGAGADLDQAAWNAAYSYYGHDLFGVQYADQVLARAIGWGRDSFCVNCTIDQATLDRIDDAWGAPARAALVTEAQRAAKAKKERERRKKARARKRRKEAAHRKRVKAHQKAAAQRRSEAKARHDAETQAAKAKSKSSSTKTSPAPKKTAKPAAPTTSTPPPAATSTPATSTPTDTTPTTTNPISGILKGGSADTGSGGPSG